MKHGGILMIFAGLLLHGSVSAAGNGQLLDRLRTNHAAMVASERDFHEQQRLGRLSRIEATDYAAYVARLHRLVAEDCAQLALAGVELPVELGCPVLSRSPPAPAAIDQSAEQTLDEQIAAFDAELRGGLGEFDEMLLRDQERVRAEAPQRTAGSAGGGSGSDGGAAGAENGDAGSAAGASNGGGAEQASGGAGDESEGMGGREPGARSQRQGDRAATPRDIPKGDDDDVVARQLREAAEKETSPELKAKLWEEYRKYKEGAR